jgi:DNA-binding transcriptional ArsR family regulator
MPPRSRESPFDYEGLAEFLGALSYPVRLELLHVLRFPQILGDIRLQPRRGSAGTGPAKSASRPAILGHLEKLETADLVRSDKVDQGGRTHNRYVVNALKLYELTEELRRLSVIYAGRGPAGEATVSLDAPPSADQVQGPRLVMVHGLYEGKTFPLDPKRSPEGKWVIGRRKGLAVSLDYDPYVSMENSSVSWEGGKFLIADLPASKNGTTVNWAPVPRDHPRALRSGDVIGVGRSLLCYAE